MAYRVDIRAVARKVIETLPRATQRRVVAGIEALAASGSVSRRSLTG